MKPVTAPGTASGSGSDSSSSSGSGSGSGSGQTPGQTNPPAASVTYTVTFDLNNGPDGATAPATATVSSGETVAAPDSDITSGGRIVAGWYQDAGLTKRWLFDIDKVTADTTLYALWVNDPRTNYTVRYVLTNSVSGNDPENVGSLTVPDDASVSDRDIIAPAPDAVTSANSDGKITAEWYKGAECTDEWDFARDAVTGDTTLYARWRDRLGTTTTWYSMEGDTLTIGGRGAMPDYDDNTSYTGTPWYAKTRSVISKLIVEPGVTTIGSCAFRGCSGLTSVTIPDSVNSIGRFAFAGCSGLTSVTIPDSVKSISDSAFAGCYRLTSVTIPDSVTDIGWTAFYGCSGLTSITIPDSVETIGSSAFKDCSGLTNVTIGNGVKTIDSSAFYGCSGLTNVTYAGTSEQWGAIAIGSYNESLIGKVQFTGE